MPTDKPGVKHITMTCPRVKCEHQAFVQVLVVDDGALQKRIDERANRKLTDALKQAHKEGLHA